LLTLLIAFNPEESSFLSYLLKQAGFEVHISKYLKPFVENWPDQPLDLLCLVIDDDPENKINTIKQLRGHTAVPILVIIDPIPESMEIELLEAGADLIVMKPYGARLLLARVKTLMRRTAGFPYRSLPVVSMGPLSLDPSQRTVRINDGPDKHLTQLEFRLLYILITHAGQIIPTESIVEHVWGYSGGGNRELVRGLVQRLRSKVEIDKSNPELILTEKGLGYYLMVDRE
jgi:DNA-binding response OmpR family regulator